MSLQMKKEFLRLEQYSPNLSLKEYGQFFKKKNSYLLAEVFFCIQNKSESPP